VRFLAAARDAFLARAERSSGVMFSRLRLPPILPLASEFGHDLREQRAFLFVHISILSGFRLDKKARMDAK
jgi:hypothetical protein